MNRQWFLTLAVAGALMAPVAGSAQGDPAAGRDNATLCVACHGEDGNSPLAVNPKIAGQNARYLLKQLRDIKSGARVSPIMTAVVANIGDSVLADISAWYASQSVTLGGASAAAVALGESLYRAGNRELGVPACAACHGPAGGGNAPAGFPALSGQHAEYTLAQLRAFRSGERDNDAGAMMRQTVERLTDKELEALASYVAGLSR